MNIREVVMEVLLSMEEKQEYSHRLMKNVLDKYDYLSARDKAMMKRMTEGCVERQLELDYVIGQFSSLPVRKMKPFIRNLLRMSTYQILYMDRIPDSAVCNEAVNLAQKKGFRNLKGFVNGVLRSIVRGKEKIVWPDAQKDPLAYLSVRYSMPVPIVKLWLDEYGREDTERMLEGLLQIHPVSIRFQTSLDKEQRMEYIARMEAMGVTVRPSPYLEYAYLLEKTDNVTMLPGFLQGAFTVQDVSSMLAVEAAAPGAGDFVMDICAAPGGKSMLAAEKAGSVLARDVSESKLPLMEENFSRMNCGNVTVQQWDGRVTDENYLEKADIVFLDVPCSGLGVIGKKRDIKYHVSEESFAELETLQKAIIEGSWRYVKPGGMLLYSTCTVHREENEKMCEWICRNFPFELQSMENNLPDCLKERAKGGMLQLMPGKDDCDGFFFAKFKRKQPGTES